MVQRQYGRDAQFTTRVELLRTMPEALREKVAQIENLLKRQFGNLLLSHYELGLLVDEIYQDQTQEGRKRYGSGAIETICEVIGWGKTTIRACLELVHTFSQEEIDAIARMEMANGEPIAWSHVREIMTLDTPEERMKWLQQLQEECWTVDELVDEIRRRKNLAVFDEGGRLVEDYSPTRRKAGQRPATASSLIVKQRDLAEKWERQYRKLVEKEWSMPPVTFIPSDAVTEDTVRQLHDLAGAQRRIAQQADEIATATEKKYSECLAILKEREGASKTVSPVPDG